MYCITASSGNEEWNFILLENHAICKIVNRQERGTEKDAGPQFTDVNVIQRKVEREGVAVVGIDRPC
jgi:hypothetical protein